MTLDEFRGSAHIKQGRQPGKDRVVVVGAMIQGVFVSMEHLQDGAVPLQVTTSILN